VQEAGRTTRSEDDLSEIFVVDDAWKWYYPAYKKFAPEYFRERVRGSVECVPDPIFPIELGIESDVKSDEENV
jgi:Rad3-related DNA helicase